MNIENTQLTNLIRDGFTPLEIACALNLDEDAVQLAIASNTKSKEQKSAEDLINKFKPSMIEILAEIANDTSLNTSARVSAASIIVKSEGCLPEVGASKLSEMFKNMKRIVATKPSDTAKVTVSTGNVHTEQTSSTPTTSQLTGAVA